MKNRVQFKNLVVSAEDLPKINQIVRLLTELSPSDAFISIEFSNSVLLKGLVRYWSEPTIRPLALSKRPSLKTILSKTV